MRVGVLGLGLIGGSIALDLVALDESVVAWDIDGATVESARGAGIPIAGCVEEVAADADLVVVAVPPPLVAETIAAVVATGEVAVTDVASVRRPEALGLTGVLPPSWVGSHPMAGTERSGFGAAHRGLLVGAPWLLTPHDRVAAAALTATADLALRLQARPMVVDPDFHDEVVATLSHLPHLVAFALNHQAETMGAPLAAALAGPSFRDATRVAASSPSFWGDLLDRNRPAVLAALSHVQDWLSTAMDGDEAELTRTLAAARRHPGPQLRSDQSEVVVLDDMSVALSRLRSAGRAGRALTAVGIVGGREAITLAGV